MTAKKKRTTSNYIRLGKSDQLKRTEISVKIASQGQEIRNENQNDNENENENKNESMNNKKDENKSVQFIISSKKDENEYKIKSFKVHPTLENFSADEYLDQNDEISLPIIKSLPLSSKLECVSIDIDTFDDHRTFSLSHPLPLTLSLPLSLLNPESQMKSLIPDLGSKTEYHLFCPILRESKISFGFRDSAVKEAKKEGEGEGEGERKFDGHQKYRYQ